jgi:cytochrome c biogenesis protein CcmG, thiol:disulfide interchange protein DsbE
MTEGQQPGARKRPRLVFLVPLALFAALAALFLIRLETGGGSDIVPSALVGKTAPDFSLPALEGSDLPGLSHASLLGNLTLVNVFASWCGPCRIEHPQLEILAKDSRIRLVGINYKDQPQNAGRFLEELGNPYAAIGVDKKGRAAIDWGVYGVPETFIVSPKGIILHKFVGPITEEALEQVMKPEIEKALAAKR